MKTSPDKPIYLKLSRIMLCLFLVTLYAGCDRQERSVNTAPQNSQSSEVKYEGTVIALGNSLTAGLGVAEELAYPSVLQEKLQQAGYNWQVINAGISGETSSGALSRINWIIVQQPDIVILETGANDGMRGIPVRVIKENLRRTIELLQEAEIVVVLAGMQMLQNLGPAYTNDFAAIYPAVAEEQDVILVPFFLEKVAADPALNLPDGIHPTPAGHRIVAETVYPFVVKAIQRVQQQKSAGT